MRKRKYIIGIACVALSVGLSLNGCSKKEDITETETYTTEADPNHTPYKEMDPEEVEDPFMKETEYWTEAVDIDERIEQEAADEKVKTEENDESNKADEAPAYVVDDTGEQIEVSKSLDGGGAITIQKEEEYTSYNNMTDETEVGKIIRFDDYDSLEIKPSALSDGLTYTVENGMFKCVYPDGKTIEVLKVGTGFVDASKLTMSTVKSLASKYFNFDASGGDSKKYDVNNNGPQIVGEASSGDLKSSIVVVRGNNGVYAIKYTGVLPYDYIEMESNVLIPTMN